MESLTKEQAIVISGYTGFTMCDFALIHEDIEKRCGHPVMSHSLGSRLFVNDIVKPLYKDDFLALCYTGK